MLINSKRYLEALLGLVVIVIFCLFLNLLYKVGESKLIKSRELSLYAIFSDIDGIERGTNVKIAGYTVGEVTDIKINENYQALVTITISDSDIKIPNDSSLKVLNSGLIGGKYLGISIGASEDFLKNEDFIQFTQSSISIDGIIQKVFLNKI